MIAVVAAQGAAGHPGGWVSYAMFAAEVNVLLAVVNVLPVSGSDGYHLYRRLRRSNAAR